MFVRTVTADGLRNAEKNFSGTQLIFNPDVLDRTDWYAYNDDHYGRTEPSSFLQRQSPTQMFENQKQTRFREDSEQMFRLGISSQKIMAIASKSKHEVIKIEEVLRKDGITEINGRPIEEMILFTDRYKSLIDISNGNPNPEVKNLAQLFKENPEEMEKIKWEFVTGFIEIVDQEIRMWKEMAKIPSGPDAPEISEKVYFTSYRVLGDLQNPDLEEYFRKRNSRYVSISDLPDKYRLEILDKLRVLSDSISVLMNIITPSAKAKVQLVDSLKSRLEFLIGTLNKTNQ